MLSGETRGSGGAGLARHLLSTKSGQVVRQIAARHVAAPDLPGQLRQLVTCSAHGRTRKPIWHVHIDPPVGFDRPDVIGTFLGHLEREFGLEDQPRAGVLHTGKGGSDRLHCHIVWSLVRPDGRTVDLRNSFRRREKCSVITACELGLPAPPIPKPRAIIRALISEGREREARWMLANYDGLRGPVRISDLSPARRHIAERTAIAPDEIRTVLATVWPPSSPRTFRSQLAAAGIVLARGDKVPVVVDRSGAAHALGP